MQLGNQSQLNQLFGICLIHLSIVVHLSQRSLEIHVSKRLVTLQNPDPLSCNTRIAHFVNEVMFLASQVELFQLPKNINIIACVIFRQKLQGFASECCLLRYWFLRAFVLIILLVVQHVGFEQRFKVD